MNCFMCKAQIERQIVNYFLDLKYTMVIIKDVPADVCTQCGERYFDDKAMGNLERIVQKLKQLPMEMCIVNYKVA